MLENIRRELELSGTSLDKVFKATVFLSFFTTDPPAPSCVEVASLLDKDALVEIEVIAGT